MIRLGIHPGRIRADEIALNDVESGSIDLACGVGCLQKCITCCVVVAAVQNETKPREVVDDQALDRTVPNVEDQTVYHLVASVELDDGMTGGHRLTVDRHRRSVDRQRMDDRE